MMRRWGIRKKVLVMALVPTVTITLLIGLFFTHSWVQNISGLLQERGESLSRQLAAAAEYGAFTGNRSLLFSLASSMLEEKDVRSVTLYDSEGKELVHTGPRLSAPVPAKLLETPSTAAHEGADASLYISPIFLQDLMMDSFLEMEDRRDSASNAPIGWAAVEMSHDSTEKERYKALLISLLLITGGILLSALMALRMSRSVTDPIFQLTRGVTKLKEGKLDTRIYTDAGPELEQLESGLNEMAQELSKAHLDMQQNIDQATEDLRETLETIEIQNIELDLARKEALEASRIKSEFLANMSHEIRTPLNGIIGFTDLMLKGPLTQQQRDHLNTIRKSSEILLTIINDILDFSKIEAGKLVLDRVPFRLRDIVEDVMVMLAPAAHAKNLDLVHLVYEDVPDNIVGDPLRIKQVITNLLNNAIKFTQSGEVVLRAMLEDDSDEHLTIRMSVTDTGVGLSRSQQQTLFNAFSQADASTARQYGGTGLGLVISRRLVEEMGGQIGLDSDLGKGSTFWFTLNTELAANASPPPQRDGLRGERVLYLEQQKTTGLCVEHMLKRWEMELDHAQTPADVMDSVIAMQEQQHGYAAVILGLQRHLLNSSHYRELIQQLEIERDCRVLLLTPTLEESEVPFTRLASAHLVKPVCREKLYNALFRLVHGDDPEYYPRTLTTQLERPAPTGRAPRVLAVDDNDANLKLVLTLLREMKIEAEGAASGYEALTRMKQRRFDLVFMDVQMPGMDGVETTERIRELAEYGNSLPVIALTAHALSEEKDRLLRSGFDGFLTKPINTEQLRECISKRTGYQFDDIAPDATDMDSEGWGDSGVRPSARERRARSVDIRSSLELAANKADLAEELFSMLLEHLIEDEVAIRELWREGDHSELLERIHKLHGATRYCGVPELRTRVAELETALKRGETDIELHVERVLDAIAHINRWCEQTDWQKLFRDAAEKQLS